MDRISDDEYEIEIPNNGILTYEEFNFLRCSMCQNYLNCPPIMYFVNKKALDNVKTACGRCYKEGDTHGTLKAVRNVSAELLASVTAFPCRYYNKGCREYRRWPNSQLHEQECLFRTFEGILFDGAFHSLTGEELIKKYTEECPHLMLNDGVIPVKFENDLELPYLIVQNTDLFICKVKYDATTFQAVFSCIFLETKEYSEVKIRFNSENSTGPISLDSELSSEPRVVDLKSIKNLLNSGDAEIKCEVILNLHLLKHTESELLRDIECPSCWEYMKGKIFLCQNGHSICFNCKPRLNHCPSCRHAVDVSARNYSLEKVVSQAFFPCKNHKRGCLYISTLDQLDVHLSRCKYAPAD